jgi:hypothetical protein
LEANNIPRACDQKYNWKRRPKQCLQLVQKAYRTSATGRRGQNIPLLSPIVGQAAKNTSI